MATPTLHPHPFSTLPLIDLRHLSQPDLTSLSTTQTPLFDHIIIPQIDRSNFNESAGSRKQTYSRQRLAPNPTSSSTTSVGRRRGCSTHAPPFSATNPSEDESENKKIVSVLRDLFYKSGSHIVLHAKKRKAVGAAGNEDEVFYDEMKGGGLGENVVMEIVNRNGCVVDIKGLMSVEDPYKVELEKRTEGLESEEELLGYLRGLKGVWGSRRMKRKVVDAGNFGDWLPVGWKLLLSLKRREGKVWMYCRRYISPYGQQFHSCKEVSSYLHSFFGPQDDSHQIIYQSDKDNRKAYNLKSAAASSIKSENTIADHKIHGDLLGADNLAEVEIKDLLECSKCKTNFDDKETYLDHLLTTCHKKYTKKSRFGMSVGDGVIIRDGKFECQFCHKIFDERNRYNGHVGTHIKNYVRSLSASPSTVSESMKMDVDQTWNEVPSRISGASIDLGKSYIVVNSGPVTNTKACEVSALDKLQATSVPKTSIPESNHKSDIGFIPLKQVGSSDAQILVGKINDGLNAGFLCSKLSTDGFVSPISTKRNDELNVSFSSTLGVGSTSGVSFVETSTVGVDTTSGVFVVKASCELDVGLNSTQKAVAQKADQCLIGHHPNPQDRCSEMEIHDVWKINGPSNNVGGELESCLESLAGNIDEKSACETYGQKVFNAESATDIGKSDAHQQAGSISFSNLLFGSEENDFVENLVNEVSSVNVNDFGNHLSKSGFQKAEGGSLKDVAAETMKTNDDVVSKTNEHCKNIDLEQTYSYGMTDFKAGQVTRACESVIERKQNSYYEIGSDQIEEIDQRYSSLERGQNSNYEMTHNKVRRFDEADDNVGEQDIGFEITDDMVEKINEVHQHNIDGEQDRSFEVPTDLVERIIDAPNTVDEEQGREYEMPGGMIDKIDKSFSIVEGSINSCLDSATTLFNNVGGSAFKTYDKSYFYTTPTDEIEKSAGPFNFLFGPSENEENVGTQAVENSNFSVGESEEGPRSGFDRYQAGFVNNYSTETNGLQHQESNMLLPVVDTSSSGAQPSCNIPTLNLFSEKGGNDFSGISENISGFDELAFDVMEPSKYGFVARQHSNSLVEESMDLSYDDNSVHFNWDTVLPEMHSNQQMSTAVCGWCRLPFNHDSMDLDMQSNFVGYMCPTCKSKTNFDVNFSL